MASKQKEYDLRRLSPQLQPLAFLVGKWRSEHGGKAIFPTIPKFTYGEEVDISIPDDALQAAKALNYTMTIVRAPTRCNYPVLSKLHLCHAANNHYYQRKH
ncbi:hypothetical protein COOONC_27322 [Cooperia oncophora]